MNVVYTQNEIQPQEQLNKSVVIRNALERRLSGRVQYTISSYAYYDRNRTFLS